MAVSITAKFKADKAPKNELQLVRGWRAPSGAKKKLAAQRIPLTMLDNASKTSNVQATPRVVHSLTWVDLRTKATRSKSGVG